jgi:hypothetical protein
MTPDSHPSSSTVQQKVEATVLRRLGEKLGATLSQGHRVEIGGSHMQPDGMNEDGSVVVRSSPTSGP